MQLSLTSRSLLVLGMLLGISSAAPAAQELSLPGGLPPTCVKFDNGVLKTPTCYTATVTKAPLACPAIECPIQTDLMCPEYIVLTTVTVPCSTDCCPTTPTHTVTTKCPGCHKGCVIPTETVTVRTGCSKTVGPGVILTPPPTITGY